MRSSGRERRLFAQQATVPLYQVMKNSVRIVLFACPAALRKANFWLPASSLVSFSTTPFFERHHLQDGV
jgi:hypothetical protein